MPKNLDADMVVEVKAYCQSDQQQAINVFHFKVNSVAGGTFSDELLAAQLSADFALIYKAWLPSVCRYNGVRVQILDQPIRPIYQVSRSGAGIGAKVSAPLPSLTCLLVTKFTQLGGPRGRGRTFIPFWSEADNDAQGIPEAAGVALADSLAAYVFNPVVFLVGGVTINMSPVLYHRDTHTTDVITSYLIKDSTWYHQVKRANDNKPDVLGP